MHRSTVSQRVVGSGVGVAVRGVDWGCRSSQRPPASICLHVPSPRRAKSQAGTPLKTIETMGVNGEVVVDPEYYRVRALKGAPGMSST